MSFRKSLLILCALSLVTGAAFFALGMKLNPVEGRNVYAALITSADVPDRKIRELLKNGTAPHTKLKNSNWSDSFISESSSWALLDNFSGIEKIPLDQYEQRVFPLDPRNDGYAKRLRDFFITEGNRFFFIPLHSVSGGNLEKLIAPLLGEIPFSIEPLSSTKPVRLFLVFFGAAVLCIILLRITTGNFIFCLPALVSLAFYGAAGFVLAALLLALAVLVKEPLVDFFSQSRYRKETVWSPSTQRQLKNYLAASIRGPFKINWLLTFVITAFYILFAVTLLKALALAAGIFFVFAAVFVFSISTFSLRGDSQGHIRFNPVLITKSAFNWRFLVAMLPFGFAALASILSASFAPSSQVSVSPFVTQLREKIVAEDEYLAHAAFQSSFSNHALDQHKTYHTYVQADDGLIDISPDSDIKNAHTGIFHADASQAGIPQVVIPPYPLRDLMRFLTPPRKQAKAVQELAGAQDKE